MTSRSSAPGGEVSDNLREVLLTLTPTQFEGFARDLKVLRESHAGSNTQAIVDAVHQRATTVKVAAVEHRSAA